MLEAKENFGEFDGRRFLGSSANLYHFLVFPLHFGITGRLATEVFQHFERFFMTADRGEETGRVWQKSDKDGKNDRGDALEGQEKPPTKRGPAFEVFRSSFHERETEIQPVSYRDAQIIGLRQRKGTLGISDEPMSGVVLTMNT